jgi:hypothetical protein
MNISKVIKDESEADKLGFNEDEEMSELEEEVSEMDSWEYREFLYERFGFKRED